MFGFTFTRLTAIRLTVVLSAALLLGALFLVDASAEGPDNGADLKARFEALSQHGNVECSVQFEKSIPSSRKRDDLISAERYAIMMRRFAR